MDYLWVIYTKNSYRAQSLRGWDILRRGASLRPGDSCFLTMREGSAWQKGARETESTLDTIHDRGVSPIREGRTLMALIR